MEREESLGPELEIRERESLRSLALGFRSRYRGKSAQVQPWRLNLGLAIEQEKETDLPQMVARGGGLWWHEVEELQVVWPRWVWDQRNLREELRGSRVRVREWWWWQVAGLGGLWSISFVQFRGRGRGRERGREREKSNGERREVREKNIK